MKTLLIAIIFFSISTMSFAQVAMNTVSGPTTETNEPVITDKAKKRLATIQTRSITTQLSNYISTQVAYDDLMVDNAIEGTLILKVTFNHDGEIASTQVIESPHSLLSTLVLKTVDSMFLEGFEKTPYYGPEAMIIPISFSLR